MDDYEFVENKYIKTPKIGQCGYNGGVMDKIFINVSGVSLNNTDGRFISKQIQMIGHVVRQQISGYIWSKLIEEF